MSGTIDVPIIAKSKMFSFSFNALSYVCYKYCQHTPKFFGTAYMRCCFTSLDVGDEASCRQIVTAVGQSPCPILIRPPF